MYIGEQSQKTGCFACTMLNEDKNLFETISFMKNNVEMTDKKEIYVAPVCECIEVDMEGMLCSSGDKNPFETEGDDFLGEW